MMRNACSRQSRTNTRRLAVFAGLLLLIVLLAGGVNAQSNGSAVAPTNTAAATAVMPATPTATHEMTPEDVSAFMDGIIPLQLAREDIAGAVVLVVKDGKVLFSKGYGYADLDKKVPVTADGTLFRPGSVSKLFVWTSVMQLVEQGKLDLDRDVNAYIDFKIPEKFGKPITLRNIMTHTSGFEESGQDLFVDDVKNMHSIGEYLKTHLPERIFPPGTTPAYSNYATTVAGYIVQRVSGEDFYDYIDHHIFSPLEMRRSTFRQPLPEALMPLMSKGYKVASQPEKKFEIVQGSPAGSSSMTASDISHFMIAHLQDGKYENVEILKPETAKLMHARAFENHPAMNGMALGFYEESRNGQRIIGHGGDTEWFHSDLHLFPETGVGFFVSYNSMGKGEIRPREAVWGAFLNRYFPYNPPAGQAVATAAEDARLVSGRYLISRGFETNILRALTVMTDAAVRRNEDGTISLDLFKDLNGKPKRFTEISPLLFRAVNGQEMLGFKRMDSGEFRLIIDFPFMVFRQAHGSDDSRVILILLIFSVVVLLLTLLAWPIGAWIRWHNGIKPEFTTAARRYRFLTRLTCVFDASLIAAFVLFFSIALSGASGHPGFGVVFLVRVGQLLAWVGVVGAVAALYNAYVCWSERRRWIWSKLGYSLTAVACVAFSWFALAFHFLNWNLKY